jgi:hypothetical protein
VKPKPPSAPVVEARAPLPSAERGAGRLPRPTCELYPREASTALRRMRQAYRKPPMTASELVLDLMRVGLPRLAALVRQEIELL